MFMPLRKKDNLSVKTIFIWQIVHECFLLILIKTQKVLQIEILFFILFFLIVKYFKVFHIKGLSSWVMQIGFSIKVLIGIVFIFIYTHPDTNNSVPSDTMRFMKESKILNNVFYESSKDYFTLLFGFSENKRLISKYLSETFLWDAGSYTLSLIHISEPTRPY